jgi:hypothetical protein
VMIVGVGVSISGLDNFCPGQKVPSLQVTLGIPRDMAA